jgi:hypothetical protein
MIWALIAAFGLASWLSAAMLILGLCRAASLRPASDQPSVFVSGETNVVDLRAFRAARTRPLENVNDAAAAGRGGGSYLSSLESRRSLRSLPSVWQVGQ